MTHQPEVTSNEVIPFTNTIFILMDASNVLGIMSYKSYVKSLKAINSTSLTVYLVRKGVCSSNKGVTAEVLNSSNSNGPLTKRKIAGCACAGNAGNVTAG